MDWGELTPTKIAKLGDGMHFDSPGLSLKITNSRKAKSWVLRFTNPTTGKPDNMGLGSYRKVNIDRARKLRNQQHDLIAQGLDPKVVREDAKLEARRKLGLDRTVNQVIDEFLDVQIFPKNISEDGKKNIVYQLKIVRRAIGEWPIEKVNRDTLLDTVGLRKLWFEIPTTAQQVRFLLRRLFEYAIGSGYYTKTNPTDGLDAVLPPIEQIRDVKHALRVEFKDIYHVLEAFRSYRYKNPNRTGPSNIATCVVLVALTGCRPGEARKARWDAFDRGKGIWTVPPREHKDGWKSKKPLLRPITSAMERVLDEMNQRYPNHAQTDPVFPSQSYFTSLRGAARIIELSSIRNFIRRSIKPLVNLPNDFASNGFRSTFTDWARSEGYPKELWHVQTGHRVGAGDKVMQAYARDDLVNQRRPMMEAWGDYCSKPPREPIVEGTNIESLHHYRRKA
jgi:integrase